MATDLIDEPTAAPADAERLTPEPHAADVYSRPVFVMACVCLGTALLPIALGAQTTTEGAGMAFLDYPTSNGEGMFEYDFSEADRPEFLEHGHRLAGTLIGFAAIGLCGTALVLSDRKLVKGLSVGVLLAVISQGLLGGVRVLRENTDLAALHGFTAALTLSIIAATVVVSSRKWLTAPSAGGPLKGTKILAVVAAVLLAGQYVLGGQMRHFGYAWAQTGHLHLSFWAFASIVAAGVAAIRTRIPWLRSAGVLLHAVVTVQMLLGFATWAQKYGVQASGYVAQPTAPVTLYLRSTHMLVGTVLAATLASLIVRVWHVARPADDAGSAAALAASPTPSL